MAISKSYADYLARRKKESEEEAKKRRQKQNTSKPVGGSSKPKPQVSVPTPVSGTKQSGTGKGILSNPARKLTPIKSTAPTVKKTLPPATADTGFQTRSDFDKYVSMMAPGNESKRLQTNIAQLRERNDRLSTQTQNPFISPLEKANLGRQLEDVRNQLNATINRANKVKSGTTETSTITPEQQPKQANKPRGRNSALPFNVKTRMGVAQDDVNSAYDRRVNVEGYFLGNDPGKGTESYRDTSRSADRNITESVRAKANAQTDDEYRNYLDALLGDKDYDYAKRVLSQKEYQRNTTADRNRYDEEDRQLNIMRDYVSSHYSQGADDELDRLRSEVDAAGQRYANATQKVTSFYAGDDPNAMYAASEAAKRCGVQYATAKQALADAETKQAVQKKFLALDDQYGFSSLDQNEDFESVSGDTSHDDDIIIGSTTVGPDVVIWHRLGEEDGRSSFLTDEEKRKIRYLYNQGGNDLVWKYVHDYIGQEVDRRQYEAESEEWRKKGHDANFGEAALYTLLDAVNLGSVGSSLETALSKWFGGNAAVNPYGETQRESMRSREAVGGIQQNLSEIGGWKGYLASTAYSAAQSFAKNWFQRTALGHGALGLMAGEVFDASIQKAVEETPEGEIPDYDRVFNDAASDAFIEVLTEYLPLDMLLKAKPGKNLGTTILNGLKQMGVEGGEEGVGNFLTRLRDNYVYGEDEVDNKTQQYIDEGMPPDKARKRAEADWWKETGTEVLVGALAGAGGYVTAVAPAAISDVNANRQIGKDIMSNGNTDAFVAAMGDITNKPVANNQSARRLGEMYGSIVENEGDYMERALREDEAQAAVNRWNDLKTTFDQTLGEQANTNTDTAQETVQDNVQETAPSAPNAVEDALRAMGMGERLSPEQVAALRSDEAAWQTAQELNNARAGKNRQAWVDNAPAIARQKAADTIDRAVFAPVAPMEGTSEATQQKAEERSKNLKTSPTGNTQVVDDDGRSQDAKVVRIESVANGDTDAQVVVDVGGEERTVPLSDIAFGNETKNGQQVMAYAADMPTPEIANAFRATVQPSQDMARVAAGMANAYNMGRQGYRNYSTVEGSVLTQGITSEQRRAAYDMGVRARQGNVQAQTEAAQNRQKNFAGNEWHGGNFDTSQINEANLAPEQRQQVNALRELSKVTGWNYVLFESQADASGSYMGSENGRFDRNTGTVYIDINAGRNSAGDSMAQTAILRTVSHELTHAIQRDAPELYDQLKSAVVDVLGTDSPVDIEDLIDRKLSADPSLNGNRDLALDEVVADACETMLRDSDAIDRLAQMHPETAKSFGQKVLDFLSKLRNAIVQAFGGERGARHTEAQVLLRNIDTAAERWSEALVAASEARGRENAQTAEAGDAQTLADVNLSANDDGDVVFPDRQLSVRSWNESDYVQNRDKAAAALVKKMGDITIDEARTYIDNINSIAAIFAGGENLQFEPEDLYSAMKPNSDYKWTIDFSTLCKKRLLYTGTFDAIQSRLGDVALTADDYIALRNLMAEKGYEVACAFCYVESRRKDNGRIIRQFLDQYHTAQDGNGIMELGPKNRRKTFNIEDGFAPSIADFNTVDGITNIMHNHPDVFDAYLYFMNARGVSKPKLIETRTDYRNEILKKFRSSRAVASMNRRGGLRLQSFSDFEVINMLDMMQVTLDMARVGLTSQAYTKVPKFAEVFGGTGIKINLSLVTKGLDANGNLVFDDVEGMPANEAFRLRDMYPADVGTILVGRDDATIEAALADPRIDFVIPYHRSGWSDENAAALGLSEYTDYSASQEEKMDGRRASSLAPSDYWKRELSGDENAQVYLDRCAEEGRTPKFEQFSHLPGYWKTLIDFKMYNHQTGEFAPQNPVRPDFNLEAAERILHEYEGGHESLPVAQDVVDEFLDNYKEAHADSGSQFSVRDATDIDAEYEDALAENPDIRYSPRKLGSESTLSAEERLARQQERYERQIENVKRRANERIERYKRRIERLKAPRDLVRRVQTLNDMLIKPSPNRHIPDDLRAAIMQMVKPFVQDEGVFAGRTLDTLRRAYNTLSENPVYANHDYDEGIADRLDFLAKALDGRRLGQLNAQEMVALNDIVGHFAHLVNHGNAIFRDGKYQQTADMAEEFDRSVQAKPDAKESLSIVAVDKLIRHGNLTAPYFFKRVGGVIGALGNDILAGQTTWGNIINEYHDKFEQIQKNWDYNSKENRKAKDLSFQTESGETVTMDWETAAYLYALWKREHSPTNLAQTRHMEKGGVVFREEMSTVKRTKAVDHPVPISANDMEQIENYLTTAQKGYADELVELLTSMAPKINEVSNRLVGYSVTGEDYYIPIVTDPNSRKTTLVRSSTPLIKNMGSLKSLTTNASNAILAQNITKIATQHISDIANYIAFAEAQDNFLKVWDYKLDANNSVKTRFREKYGTTPYDYALTFLKDVYGGPARSENEQWYMRWIRGMQKQAVALSGSVVVRQFSAIMRSTAMINPKYLATAGIGSYKEGMKYSGAMVAKEIGGFDTVNNKSAQDWFLGGRTVRDKIDAVISAPPNLMDKLAWSIMWNAVKNEQAAQTGLAKDSEELLKRAGKRMDEVMSFTQVYGSNLVKSQSMRDHSAFMKMLTQFMAEGTLNLNMLMDSTFNLRHGNVGKGFRESSVLLSTVVFDAMLASLVYALRRKDNDEDSTYIERYLQSLGENLNPIEIVTGWLPAIRDVYSIFQGYDVERTDMSLLNDSKAYLETVWNEKKSNEERRLAAINFLGIITGMPAKNATRAYTSIQNAIKLSDNKLREGWLEDVWRDVDLGLFGNAVTKSEMYEGYVLALKSGTKDEQEQIMSNISTFYEKDEQKVASGITSAIKQMYLDDELTDAEAASLLKKVKGEDYDAAGQVYKWKWADDNGETYSNDKVKEKYLGGEYTSRKAQQILVEAGMNKNDAYWKIDEWDYNNETGSEKDYSKYRTLRSEMLANNAYGIQAAVDELFEHSDYKSMQSGADSIASAVTEYFKPLYKAASETERQEMEQYLLAAYSYIYGKTEKGYKGDAKKLKDIRKWLKD